MGGSTQGQRSKKELKVRTQQQHKHDSSVVCFRCQLTVSTFSLVRAHVCGGICLGFSLAMTITVRETQGGGRKQFALG